MNEYGKGTGYFPCFVFILKLHRNKYEEALNEKDFNIYSPSNNYPKL